MKKIAVLLLFMTAHKLFPQQSQRPPEYEGKPVGGKEEVEQILSTQLTLPKAVLTSYFSEEICLYYDLDSNGKAIRVKYPAGLNNMVRNELNRMLRYITFSHSQSALTAPYPYWFVFKIGSERYSKFLKQTSKNKLKSLAADSSMTIYSKAERSPEYFKNGEEGMNEFVLSEIEYPKLAVEKSVEGTVVLDFIVETNGYVTGVKVRQGVNAGCTEEAIRIIKKSRWQPAELGGKYVRYRNSYPITFSLRNVNRDGTSTIGQ